MFVEEVEGAFELEREVKEFDAEVEDGFGEKLRAVVSNHKKNILRKWQQKRIMKILTKSILILIICISQWTITLDPII